MPVADAGVGLPRIGPDVLHHTTFNIERAGAHGAVFGMLAGVDRFNFSAMAMRVRIVIVREHIQTMLLKWKRTVAVQEIRMMLVHQVLDAQKPFALPRLGNALFIPR